MPPLRLFPQSLRDCICRGEADWKIGSTPAMTFDARTTVLLVGEGAPETLTASPDLRSATAILGTRSRIWDRSPLAARIRGNPPGPGLGDAPPPFPSGRCGGRNGGVWLLASPAFAPDGSSAPAAAPLKSGLNRRASIKAIIGGSRRTAESSPRATVTCCFVARSLIMMPLPSGAIELTVPATVRNEPE